MYWSQVRILVGPPNLIMKISVFGMSTFSQLIEDGFKKLGHTVSSENPDLIFANDPRGYDKSLILKKINPEATLIFNLLDIPWHMPNAEIQTKLLVKHYLSKADIITVISYKVQKDLEKFISKKTHVIYNPKREVYYDKNIKKDDSFLFVGRANDPIKRIKLVYDSLLKIKDGLKNLKICGQHNPGFGNYLGYVSDHELSKLYNSSKYVFLPSKAEGIGLPMIEAMICGSIPILCSDNETAREFSPEEFICEPDADSIVNKINDLNKNYLIKRDLALKFGKKYKKLFDKVSVAENILSIKK